MSTVFTERAPLRARVLMGAISVGITALSTVGYLRSPTLEGGIAAGLFAALALFCFFTRRPAMRRLEFGQIGLSVSGVAQLRALPWSEVAALRLRGDHGHVRERAEPSYLLEMERPTGECVVLVRASEPDALLRLLLDLVASSWFTGPQSLSPPRCLVAWSGEERSLEDYLAGEANATPSEQYALDDVEPHRYRVSRTLFVATAVMASAWVIVLGRVPLEVTLVSGVLAVVATVVVAALATAIVTDQTKLDQPEMLRLRHRIFGLTVAKWQFPVQTTRLRVAVAGSGVAHLLMIDHRLTPPEVLAVQLRTSPDAMAVQQQASAEPQSLAVERPATPADEVARAG